MVTKIKKYTSWPPPWKLKKLPKNIGEKTLVKKQSNTNKVAIHL